jgi:hypothetical protein
LAPSESTSALSIASHISAARLSYCPWYDLEMGKTYLPPGFEGDNLVVH